jgi:hypothetical protein
MPEPVELQRDQQTFLLCPRDDKTVLTTQEQTSVTTALRKALGEISNAKHYTGDALSGLGNQEFGRTKTRFFNLGKARRQILQDIMLAAFRLPPPADLYALEDYRRCLRHVEKMLQAVWVGLSRDGLVLADMENWAYQRDSPNGYVYPPWYQALAMRLAPNFRKFWEEGELKGPIHLNLRDLQRNQKKLALVLIHEATHQFGRTSDNHYYEFAQAYHLISDLTDIRSRHDEGHTSKDECQGGVDMLIKRAGCDKPETPEEALNNADSHAFFVTWMSWMAEYTKKRD